MSKDWTFEELDKMKFSEIRQCRDTAREYLANLRREKYTMIGQVLFYQNECNKEIAERNAKAEGRE